MGVRLIEEGDKVYLDGKTFDHKTLISQAGGQWDADRKMWYFGADQMDVAREVARAIPDPVHPEAQVIGHAVYKEKTYPVLWAGETKTGREALKLAFANGSDSFWVDADKAEFKALESPIPWEEYRDMVRPCFGPKIFGATRDPHADLRDRLIVVPFLRPEDTSILAALKTPTSTSEDWQAWRGRLYALYLTQFAAMRDVARSLAQEQGNNNARRGELLRPMVAIMRFCRVDEDIIEEVCDRVEQRIDEIRPSITRLDEQVLMIVWEILHEQGGGYVEIPISSIRRRCAENEDLKIASYENVVWEILKRNGAYLKSKRRAGEIVIMTNERCVHRALERLGCDLEEISPSREQDSLAPRQIAIPLARRACTY
ncbi:hypothetical protein SAMN02745206_03744 [Desulfacinum infernum DSM 9756]|uniref:DUF5710 domain-containing protein n=1 Tax=Desulfacinum infernum DSM 9756 TaxID=1121391 RepID=A0A1M5J762_9BACT|nr:hypothetical protein [Desulfacinum infernum]SHG36382.1 hypothetical protein SAMN02745206_03744 [Desulfacinum infernum DSM 9756]